MVRKTKWSDFPRGMSALSFLYCKVSDKLTHEQFVPGIDEQYKWVFLINKHKEKNKIFSDGNIHMLQCSLSRKIRNAGVYELTNTTPGKYIHSLKEIEYNKRLIVI